MNIKAVAEQAGVSITTVSRVLNHPDSVSEKTRRHVLDVMDQMNYTPNWFARNIQSTKTDIIGLLLPDIQASANMELLKGIEEITYRENCDLILFDTEYDEKREWQYVERMLERHVDGLIITSSLLSKHQLNRLTEKKIPYVLVGKTDTSDNDNVVYIDFETAAKEAIEYLIHMGHTQIALLESDHPRNENKEMISGYKAALAVQD